MSEEIGTDLESRRALRVVRRLQSLETGRGANTNSANIATSVRTVEAALPGRRAVDKLLAHLRGLARSAFIAATRPFRGFLAVASQRYLEWLRADLRAQMALDLNHLEHLHRQEIAIIEATAAESIQQVQWSAARIEAQQNDVLGVIEDLSTLVEVAKNYSFVAARRAAVPLESGDILVRTESGYVLCGSADLALLAQLIDSGETERGTRLLIERLLEPGDTFVDVGANIGLHTLAAARRLGGTGRIFAFEPFGPNAALLERSLALNGHQDWVSVLTVALSDHHGTTPLHLGSLSGHHSLYPLGQGTGTGESVDVTVTTLDVTLAENTDVDLIKIDAEGAELAVLRGSMSILQSNPNIGVIAEFGTSHLRRQGVSTSEWLSSFTDHGFEWKIVDPMSGRLETVASSVIDQLGEINIYFARSGSPGWERANRDV